VVVLVFLADQVEHLLDQSVQMLLLVLLMLVALAELQQMGHLDQVVAVVT
jgi:hypothetical protein